jgi:hypothetical protein
MQVLKCFSQEPVITEYKLTLSPVSPWRGRDISSDMLSLFVSRQFHDFALPERNGGDKPCVSLETLQ